jgi:predicted dehydrogenase
MNTEPLKLGFIGGATDSAIGTSHRIGSQMDGRWQISSGCFSTDEQINIETAEVSHLPAERLYSDWQAFLSAERDELDAVVVLTPTPLHAEIVISALEQGYAVICEKAITVSSDESKLILEAVEKQDAYLAVTYNYTGYPMVRELQALIRTGKLGKLDQIHIEMPQEGFARLGKEGEKPVPQAWRLHDEAISTLALDLASHLHHMIDFLSDEKPVELVAINNNFGHFKGIVDNTMCIARYTGNLDCQIWYGKTALGNSNGLRVRVYGTEGAAEWVQINPEILELADNKGRKTLLERSSVDITVADAARYNRFKAGHPAGFMEAFANYYYDLADSLIEYREKGSHSCPWVAGIDKAHEGMLMLDAMQKSAQSSSWQKLSV